MNMIKDKLTIPGGKKRYVGLDVFRIGLALLIFMFHSRIHFGCRYAMIDDFVSVGAIAMTGFMLLSGFVLANSYSDVELSVMREIKKFYLKRLISILPLYYSIIIIHEFCQIFTRDLKIIDAALLAPLNVLAIQSTLFSLFDFSHYGGTWFISCILICYFLFPYINKISTEISLKWKLIFLLLIGFILLYAPLVNMYYKLEIWGVYANPFYRCLEFSIGIIIGQIYSHYVIKDYLNHFEIGRSYWPAIVTITIIMMSFIIYLRQIGVPKDYMLYSFFALPFFIILVLLLSNTELRGLPVVKYLSDISFTFFLCQILPLWEISRIVVVFIGTELNLLKILISFALCLVSAITIHEGIEKPLSNYLRSKFL